MMMRKPGLYRLLAMLWHRLERRVNTWRDVLDDAGVERPTSHLNVANPRGNAGRQALPHVLILTPVKNALPYLPRYVENLYHLTYPHDKISLGFLESDSTDKTFDWLNQARSVLQHRFRDMQLFQRHFRFQPNVPRWKPSIQYQRRSILAKSRNYLLHRALDDEEWVLWLDVDVCQYPPDVIERLMEVGKEIIVPHCILQPEGTSYDLNTFRFKPGWQDRHCPSDMIDGILQPPKGRGRLYLEDLRDYDIVRVDAVGGTMLLVKADLHREGLCFPSFSYDYYIETEGFAMMARDMGYTCWGLPHVYIVHAS